MRPTTIIAIAAFVPMAFAFPVHPPGEGPGRADRPTTTGEPSFHGAAVNDEGELKGWHQQINTPYAKMTYQMVAPQVNRLAGTRVEHPDEFVRIDKNGNWWYQNNAKGQYDILHKNKPLERTQTIPSSSMNGEQRHLLTNPNGPLERSRSFPRYRGGYFDPDVALTRWKQTQARQKSESEAEPMSFRP